MGSPFNNDEIDFEKNEPTDATNRTAEDHLSADHIDAELRALNIRPNKRRRKAMRSWLAIEARRHWMFAMLVFLCSSALITGPIGGTAKAGAEPMTGRYLTILIAHSAETAVDSHCRPLPNVVTLEQQAATFGGYGIHGVTGTVITTWPQQSTDRCIVSLPLSPQPKPILVASWNRLSALAHDDGWSFVSASRTYTDVTKLSAATQQSEICGSRSDLHAHGLPGSNGLFAYPNNRLSRTIQVAVTSKCYLFGRSYGAASSPLPVRPSYLVPTYSLNGGNCNDPTLPCYAGTARYRYTSPEVLATQMSPADGHWAIVQGYRFVTGAVTADTLSWDCTSPNWEQHWTAGPDATEVYCWTDWLAALSSISPGITTVSPAQMASFRANG